MFPTIDQWMIVIVVDLIVVEPRRLQFLCAERGTWEKLE